MDIKTTCKCGTETNVTPLQALKDARFGCADCKSDVTVEVTGVTAPQNKRGR
jgi:transposase-like protein